MSMQDNDTPQEDRLWRYRDGWLGLVGRLNQWMGFHGFAWASSIVFFLVVVGIGVWGYTEAGVMGWDALYRPLQLFGLNYEPPCNNCEANGWINLARFLAPIVLIAALVKLLVDGISEQLRRIAHTGLRQRLRDIVLGYDPVAIEIGRRLLKRGRAVTWIAQITGGDEALKTACREAERDGGLLINADPSADRSFARAGAGLAERIFVALEDDAAGLDAAEALRMWLEQKPPMPKQWRPWTALRFRRLVCQTLDTGPNAPPRIRLFTQSPALANDLAHAAGHGFVSGRGVMATSLRAEAVRRLVLRARWDRAALLLGQARVHLVLAGCGWQGEALLDETLLLCLRAGLDAPLVTVLDKDDAAARERIKARSPALFDPNLQVKGWLPPRFIACDLEAVDFAALNLAPCGEPPVPVTAWAFCTGDDGLNLRAAMACQTAMQRRLLDGAPIHARVWNGHELGMDGITQVNIFGSVKDGLDQTNALYLDPDLVSRSLHEAYLATEAITDSIAYKTFSSEKEAHEKAAANWADLSASKKASNRRAHRHAAFKLNDLGFDWPAERKLKLPEFDSAVKDNFGSIEKALALAKFERLGEGGTAACIHEAVFIDGADRFLAAMANEHDRWTIDRAIDGWRLAADRDESRLLHTDMKYWADLDKDTRAYDGVLLRGLMNRPIREARPDALSHSRLVITMEHGRHVRANAPELEWKRATEIVVVLPMGDPTRPEKTKVPLDQPVIEGLRKQLGRLLAQESPKLCRLILVFQTPPTPPVLKLANHLAEPVWAARREVQCVWAWTGAPGHTPRPLLPPPPEMRDVLEPALLSRDNGTTAFLGFTGHRELADGGEAIKAIAKAFQTWLDQPTDTRPVLLTGFAGRADRLAVEVWRAGGGKVHALFPYPDKQSPRTHAWTDDPATADPQACRIDYTAQGFEGVTIMEPTAFGPSGHVLVAKEIAGKAGHLVAVWDGDAQTPRPGGTAHCVALARAAGVPVSVVAAARADTNKATTSRPLRTTQ